MKLKKIASLLLVAILVTSMLASCGGGGSQTTTPSVSTEPGAPAAPSAPGSTMDIMINVGPDPETLDPALNASVDGSILLMNSFAGLYGWDDDGSGKPVIVADCAQEVVTPTEIEGGKFQYVLTLKPGLKWSDGVDVKASDFTYAWNRAVDPATAADYQYIFDVIDGYSDTTPALNISADDAAGTVTIVTSVFCAYFDQLLAFPTYFPVRQDIVEANPSGWATDPATYISNGAFRMKEWTVGSSIVYEKNPNYWDADNVKLDTITYALSSDDDANFVNFNNGTYLFMRNVPVAMVPELKETRLNKDFFINDYIGTYFLTFNTQVSYKPGLTTAAKTDEAWVGWTPQQNAEVRHALGLLIDRNYIVNEVTQGGQMPAYGFVPAGMVDGAGSEFREKAEDWWSVDPADHEKNVAEGLEILKKYYDWDEASGTFTNFPVFEYSVNPTTGNLAMCAAIQDMWNDYGIEATVDQRDWSIIQTALSEGDFTMGRMGWIADYDDPINFLEIYVAASGNNHPRIGKPGPASNDPAYGPNKDQTWTDAYESLINQIKTATDVKARADLMYQAETVLRDAYPVIPIYYYTNPIMVSESLKGILHSPLGWHSFKYAYVG